MPSTPQRAGWWRFIAPAVLLPTLVVAILPVMEVGVAGSPKAFEAINQGRQLMGQKKVGEDGKFVIVTQNEYQAVWGGYSDGPEIAEERREAERRGREWARDHPEEMEKLRQLGEQFARENAGKLPKEERYPAPLLGVYFAFVILALVLGFALPPGRLRSGIFAGTVLIAAAVLAVQTALGLPLLKKSEKLVKPAGEVVDNVNRLGRVAGINLETPRPYARTMPWFYSAWPFLLLPIGLVVVEEGVALLAGIGKKPTKRRYEEDDDDEDDRPRRRRRRDEDDDEEERPRRNRF